MSTQNTPLKPSLQELHDYSDRLRVVKASFLAGVFIALLLLATDHHRWAWGFVIGAVLSLFSLVTLTIAVPFLTWPGAPRHMSALIIITLFMKMPIFCVGLYLATRLPGVSAFACCLGIGLAPAVISLKAAGHALNDAVTVHQPAKPVVPLPEPVSVYEKPQSALHRTPELAPEKG